MSTHSGRDGMWTCACGVRLRHSLDIWEHLGLIGPLEPAGLSRPVKCLKSDIYFDCATHGKEDA
jgi:hypothetical protein